MSGLPEAIGSPDGVETIRVTYSDLHGVCRGTDIPVGELEAVCEHGMRMTEAVMTVGLRHNVVAGFEHGFHDITALSALDTTPPSTSSGYAAARSGSCASWSPPAASSACARPLRRRNLAEGGSAPSSVRR